MQQPGVEAEMRVRPAVVSSIAWAIAGAILIIVGMTGAYTYQDWRETSGRAEERALAFATVTDAYVRYRLRETESAMSVLAEMRVGKRFDVDEARAIARVYLRSFPFIAALGVTGAGRDHLVEGDPEVMTALKKWASEQPAQPGKLLVGRALPPAGNDVPVLPLGFYFLGGEGGKPLQAIAALRSDMLAHLHRALRLEEGKVSVLLDRGGRVLAREPYVQAAIGINVSAADTLSRSIESGLLIGKIVSPSDGRTYVMGARNLDDLGLSVRAGERWYEAMQPWRDRALRDIAFAAALVVIVLIFGWMMNIRIRSEERERKARRDADANYREALDTLMEGVVSVGPDGAIKACNGAAVRILGLNGDQKRFLTSLTPGWRAWREDGSEFCDEDRPVMRALLSGEPQLNVLMEIETRDGKRRWVEANATPTFADGRISGAVVSFTDVTARRDMLRQLAAMNQNLEVRVKERTAQLQQLAAELVNVEDRERRQLSRDLHDDIAQTLAVVRMRVANLALESGEPVREVLRSIEELMDSADASIRSLAAQLAPPVLAEIGMLAGLEWLADEMDRIYGLKVHIDAEGECHDLTQTARSILYRAVRELLINVSKHAGAMEAFLECRCRGPNLVVTVDDHGKGLDPSHAEGKDATGLGLRGTRERLNYLGGSLQLTSNLYGGTRATITVPMSQVLLRSDKDEI